MEGQSRESERSDDGLGLEKLGQEVLDSIKKLPPNIPEYGESNEFWDTVSILKQPNVRYSDVRIVPPASDANGVRRYFERKIFDESGNEVGKWIKFGFIAKIGTEQRLTVFSESVQSPDGKRHDEVRISLDKNDRANEIRKIDSKDYQIVSDQGIKYNYSSDGEVIRATLVEGNPVGEIVSEKELFFNSNAALESLRGNSLKPESSAINREVSGPYGKKNLLSRLFRR